MFDTLKSWAIRKMAPERLAALMAYNQYGTYTGRAVTPERAMQLSIVWACVTLRSDMMGSMDLGIFRTIKEDGGYRYEEATDHPLYSLLKYKVNPYMSAKRFRKTVEIHKSIWGASYWKKVYVGQGRNRRLKAVYPLEPWKVKVDSSDTEPVYLYTDAQNKEVRYSRAEIFHTMWVSIDGLTCKSPIQTCREAINLGLTAEEFAARYFGNGTFPHLVMEVPGEPDDQWIKATRESMEASHQGAERAFRIGFIGAGTKLHQLTIDAEKAQLIESRQNQIEDIARIWRVPPHSVGHLLRATNNNIEHQGIELEKLTFLPECEDLEGDIDTQLLSEEEFFDGYFVEHDLDNLRRGDFKSRTEAEVMQTQNGHRTINEVRAKAKKPPVPGGDVSRVQMQMIPVSEANGLQQQPTQQQGGQQ